MCPSAGMKEKASARVRMHCLLDSLIQFGLLPIPRPPCRHCKMGWRRCPLLAPSMIRQVPSFSGAHPGNQQGHTHLQHLLIIELSEDGTRDLVGFQGHPV